MPDTVLQMSHVYKKFRRGERLDSLRDWLPSLTRRILNGPKNKGDLRKGKFWALNDICFDVKVGEAFGIIGQNGAGKSTILKLLTGIMKPTEGDMVVKGRLSALIEVGAGFHQDLTGRENIFLNGIILGMKKSEIVKKFDEIVEFSGLADFIDTPVKRYSSGMYARLGFSVAAHVNPDVLIVDEVLSVGDYLFQRKCLDKMKSILQNGATMIFVSHNLKAVADLCKRTLLLEKGKVAMVAPTNEVVHYYLNRHTGNHAAGSEKEVFITRFGMRNATTGECSDFKSGEKAFLDIEVTSNVQRDKLSITIYMQDDNNYGIFDTSTERLDDYTFSLGPGESWKCTFEISLHLSPGRYHVGGGIYQNNIQKEYDKWFPAQTILIHSEHTIHGVANLYPKIVTFQRGDSGQLQDDPNRLLSSPIEFPEA